MALTRIKFHVLAWPRRLVFALTAPFVSLFHRRGSGWHPLRMVRRLGAFLLLAGLAEGALSLWLFHVPFRTPLYVRYTHERIRPMVLDTEGRLVGLWPVARTPGRRPPPYLGAAPGPLPRYWWRLLVLLEDGNRGRWYHLFGIDFSQLPKILVRLVRQGRVTGGSTLEMQLIKTLHADTDARGLFRVLRKLRDFAFAPAVWLALDDARLARWVAAHFPFTTSGPHGLETASWLLFDRPARDLDLAQQALLAAAVKYRVDINAYDPAGWRRAQARWRRLRQRARHGLLLLERAGGIRPEQRIAAERELMSLQLPSLAPPPRIRSCLAHRDQAAQDLAARKLDARAVFLARSELLEARAELTPWLGRDWPSEVQRVVLTVPLEANCQAKWAVQNARARWLERIGRRDDAVYVLVAVADGKGDLLRFHAESAYPQYLPHALIAGGRNMRLTTPDEDVREIGSVGKVLAALLAGDAGDGPHTRYYRLHRERIVGRYPYQHREAFRNADGFTGVASRKDPRAPIEARLAFAHSDNLALMERLSRIPRLLPAATALVTAFGWHPPPDFEPVVDIPLGRLHGAPQTVQGLFAALADPDHLGVACRPTVLETVEPRPGREPVVQRALARRRRARRRVCARAQAWLQAHPAARAFAMKVLSGVLDPSLGGTAARYLASFRAGGPRHLRYSIAKTGTVNAGGPGHAVRWVWLAGALETEDGHRYTYVAQAGPLGQRETLGPHAAGGQLGALLLPVLKSLPGIEPVGAKP